MAEKVTVAVVAPRRMSDLRTRRTVRRMMRHSLRLAGCEPPYRYERQFIDRHFDEASGEWVEPHWQLAGFGTAP